MNNTESIFHCEMDIAAMKIIRPREIPEGLSRDATQRHSCPHASQKGEKRQFPGRHPWPVGQLNLSSLAWKWPPSLSMFCLSRIVLLLSRNYISIASFYRVLGDAILLRWTSWWLEEKTSPASLRYPGGTGFLAPLPHTQVASSNPEIKKFQSNQNFKKFRLAATN